MDNITTSSTLNLFLKDPFTTIDNLKLDFHGFHFNILSNDERLRSALVYPFFLMPLLAWLLLGADSTIDQVMWMLMDIPSMNFNHMIQIYNQYYGLGTHWSASVIYAALFIGISKHLSDKLAVRNSLNLCLTTGFVGLSIATFEFTWMINYAYWQHQPWVVTAQWPQLRIILQDILFAMPGIITLSALNWKEYRLNINRKTELLLLSTEFLFLLWWFYPFPVHQLTIALQDGSIWRSTQNFPQTMYTIDMNPTDALAVGEMFHADDPAVHLVNNLAKISMTTFFYSIFKIQVREKHDR